MFSGSVVSDSVTTWTVIGSFVHGDSSSKDTGVGYHDLFQGIFPTQELNQGLLHCKRTLYQLTYHEAPLIT